MKDMFYMFAGYEFSGLIFASVLLVITVIGLVKSSGKVGKGIFGVFTLVALVLGGGAIKHLMYIADLNEKLPAPGKFVTVDGRKIHVLAEGKQNGPAIVLFAGGHIGGVGFYNLHSEVKLHTRSILIDRLGTGWSDAGSYPRTTAKQAEEMIAALHQAGEEGPFIFVGHSFGGLLAANIARRIPELTAGVIALDPTPLDIIVYGPSIENLNGMYDYYKMLGLKTMFGLYTAPNIPDSLSKEIPAVMALANTVKGAFSAASAFEELNNQLIVPRAWDTTIIDKELGNMPVFVVAPPVEGDAATTQFAEMVSSVQGVDPKRFLHFLTITRNSYLRTSNNAKRIMAPKGTGHNFVYEDPKFTADTVLNIWGELNSNSHNLIQNWPGPYGGLPPFDQMTSESLKASVVDAIVEKRAAIKAIIGNKGTPTFENTILAVEDLQKPLDYLGSIISVYASTTNNSDIKAASAELTPEIRKENDYLMQNPALFDRIKQVYKNKESLGLEERRLTEVTYTQMVDQGAELGDLDKARVTEINSELAKLQGQFMQNLTNEVPSLTLYVNKLSVEGMSDAFIQSAKAKATEDGQDGEYAIQMLRPVVWDVLTYSPNRELRESVWRQWTKRGNHDNEQNNQPVIQQILKLRTEKATLFGFDNYADFAARGRMVGSAENALNITKDAWDIVKTKTVQEIAELQALAESRGADFSLQPWDKYYYANERKKLQFSIDQQELQQYLSLSNIKKAMFWTAQELFNMSFKKLENVPTVSPDIEVFEVSKDGDVLGVLYVDLYFREGKSRGSWATQYRPADNYDRRTLPIVALYSNVPVPEEGEPALLQWAYANVIFHEFGHTLHTLAYKHKYPSLGSLKTPWDFVEAPSLMFERWLLNETAISQFLIHHETGEPMSKQMMENFIASIIDERIFSVNLEYLGITILDMRIHMQAYEDGNVDIIALQSQLLEEIGKPQASDLTMYVPYAAHMWGFQYAAGMYTYLWSDIIVADMAETFRNSPGGLYDKDIAKKYYDTVLSNGNMVPIAQALERFTGKKPSPEALMRRFKLMN
jgi:peptidyl-dipeptidase Dcp